MGQKVWDHRLISRFFCKSSLITVIVFCICSIDDFHSPREHRSLVEGAQLQLQLVSRKDVEHNAHCGHAAIIMILIMISMIIMICQSCQKQTRIVTTLQKKQEMYQFIILIITQPKKQNHDDNK